MLVLMRHKDEVIRIGHDISVLVVETRADRCRLGILAPPEIEVHRQEVYAAKFGKPKLPEGLYGKCRVEHCKQPAYSMGNGLCRQHWELVQ